MKTEIIKRYKAVHTWVGILSGLALFICFYAGAISVFEDDLHVWATKPTAITSTSLAETDELINQTLAQREDARKKIFILVEEDAPARLIWEKSRDDLTPFSAQFTPSGEISISQLQLGDLANWIDIIHRTAGLPGDDHFGAGVMGVVSLLYFMALVSGVIILLPSLVKDFFAIRVGKNLKRMWLDAHNVIGIISLPFHIIIALSAVVFGLHDFFYDAQDEVVYQGQMRPLMMKDSPFAGKTDLTPATMLSPVELLAKVKEFEPGYVVEKIEIRNPNTVSAIALLWGHDDRFVMRKAAFIALNATNGEIRNTDYMPGHSGTWNSIVHYFFGLHFGTYGGNLVSWTYFILGLSGAFLFYSGNLLWIETRRRAERRHSGPVTQSKATKIMACLTIGVSLGCVLGISADLLLVRWMADGVVDPNLWHRIIYYTSFTGAVVYAFERGAAKAGYELLYACALVTVLIPITSFLAITIPALDLWHRGSFMVEVVALGLAISMLLMARAAQKRSQSGPKDSVWADQAEKVSEPAL